MASRQPRALVFQEPCEHLFPFPPWSAENFRARLALFVSPLCDGRREILSYGVPFGRTDILHVIASNYNNTLKWRKGWMEGGKEHIP